jgi:hypothetical protein
MRKTSVLAVAVLGIAGSLLTGSATAAPAARKPSVTVLAKNLVGPLRVASAADGSIWFTDNFTGTLYHQTPGAAPVAVFQGPKKAEVGAVSVNGSQVIFAVNQGNNAKGKLYTITNGGPPTLLADIGAFENATNPDGKNHYQFSGVSKSCFQQIPKAIGAPYRGVKETHPFATTTIGTTTYVADAGANAIFAVSPTGTVSTVATLKPVKVRITASGAKANRLPACVVGGKYAFEPVPTDIEAGPDGQLYVTSLPGGPEDTSLGANGRVLRIDPATGRTSTFASGLVSPTGVAVSPTGDVYVAQLFAGVISRIAAGSGKVKTYAEVPLPGDVEISPTGLLATTNAVPGRRPKGEVVAITP